MDLDDRIMDWLNRRVFDTPMKDMLYVFMILFATVLVARTIRFLLNRYLKKSSDVIQVDYTQYNFFKSAIIACIYFVGIAVAIHSIPKLRAISVSIFAGAGILAAIIGFASQQAFSNIVSGIFIVIFKPFRVSDRVKIGEAYAGVVEDITLRHTVIRNFENQRIIIPNSIMSSETIVNSSIVDQKICKFIEFGISYDSNVDKAIKIIQEEALAHPSSIDNRNEADIANNEPVVSVRVMGFGDSSVNLRAWVWANDPPTAFKMGCDLNKSIKERFDKEGIEIPFPYRTIVFKKDISPSG